MLRLILISATLFITFMNFRYPTIFLDVQLFNFTFIILNGLFSFRLIMKLVPPKFSSEEMKLYNKYFSRYFKPNEFRKFVDGVRRKVYRVNSSITNQGNSFSSLFFVADIVGENVSVNLKSNGSLIKSMPLYGWIGIIEYVEVIGKETLSQAIANGCDFGTWGVNLEVNFNIEEVSEENMSQSHSLSEEPFELDDDMSHIAREVVIYEFDLESLNKMFNDKEDGNAIKNSLHSLWLLYFSEYIYKFEANKKSEPQIMNQKKKSGSVILNESSLNFLQDD